MLWVGALSLNSPETFDSRIPKPEDTPGCQAVVLIVPGASLQQLLTSRFMGSYRCAYKSCYMYHYGYPTYNIGVISPLYGLQL